MADMMTFPDTVEEFMEEYKLVDTEQVYTNGTELVPIFRMKQWFEHEKEQLSCGGTTSDTISRTEVVEHLRRMLEATVPNTDYDEGFVDGVEFGVSTVSTMPSAQPEIVRCKDCIYYNWDCVDAPYGMTQTICWCDLHYDAVNDNLAVNPDDFCSRAERRTDADD